jgi:hypothetical protein
MTWLQECVNCFLHAGSIIETKVGLSDSYGLVGPCVNNHSIALDEDGHACFAEFVPAFYAKVPDSLLKFWLCNYNYILF